MLLFCFSISLDAKQAQTNKRNLLITEKTLLNAPVKKNQACLYKYSIDAAHFSVVFVLFWLLCFYWVKISQCHIISFCVVAKGSFVCADVWPGTTFNVGEKGYPRPSFYSFWLSSVLQNKHQKQQPNRFGWFDWFWILFSSLHCKDHSLIAYLLNKKAKVHG